jgi:hypothetical protein
MKPIVHVIWFDAVSIDSWHPVDDLKKDDPAEIHSVGFLIADNKSKITLALNLDSQNDNASCTMVIPKKWIKSVKVVRDAKKTNDRANRNIRNRS